MIPELTQYPYLPNKALVGLASRPCGVDDLERHHFTVVNAGRTPYGGVAAFPEFL
jgi:hypothetical protein